MSVFIAKIFQTIFSWPIYLILKLFVDYKVNGVENLSGLEKKTVIFAANHASYLDGPICGAAMPNKYFFPLRFLIAENFFKWSYLLVPLFLKINAGIKLRQTGGALGIALWEAITALICGAKIWIFPEGQLTPDGKIHQGKRGIAYLYKMTDAPIIPIGISGNFNIASKKYFFKRGKIRVKIGKPFHIFPTNASLEEIVKIIMKEIQTLEHKAKIK